MKLKIAETFLSLQGEGHLTGKLTYFVRLAGCTVTQCPLHPANKSRVGECDTDWSFDRLGDPGRLINEAAAALGKRGWVCITGGEPLDQPDGSPLRRRQIAWLAREGWPHVVAWDGWPRVAREYHDKRMLGVRGERERTAAEPDMAQV